MNLYPLPIALLILCFTTLTVHGIGSTYLAGDVSIDCGSSGKSASINGREWIGDKNSKLSSVLHIKGSSTISPVIHKRLISVDESLYNTARISKFRFSYVFEVNPGQKIIRFHFNPTLYKGFKGFRDLFTVEAGPFTLLGNFSASLVAEDLAVNYFVKEFCLSLHEDEQLNIVFTPSSTPSLNTYAFINGIEIITVPSDVSYFHGGDTGIQFVGQKSQVYVDYSTALERIHRLVIKHNSLQDVDVDGIFPGRLTRIVNTVKNSTWKIPVDMGFRYLIRLHLSEWGHKNLGSGNAMFDVFINEMVANILGIAQEQNGTDIPWYMDYMVMMRGQKEEVKHDLFISVLLDDKLRDGHGPLAAIEVLKLSNHDNSLAAPNPLPLAQNSLHWTIQTPLLVLGHGNVVATVAAIVICLINVVFQILQKVSVAGASTDGILVKAQRVCRQFSLSEIKLATRNFSDGLLIGRGGFGKVYKGFIDNGKTVVAVKRLNPSSSQGAREFLIEIETLSELRHFNLVSLCGYCCTAGEMILVYDYMVGGTLAHHLFNLPSDDNDDCSPLTWKQRLNICIGAARGLDYLHTGHGVIHRDVKSSNILLDENFVAKVSDFGLARYEDISKLGSHVSTKVKGTKGYWDPHYITTGKLTRKSDTYAFGVVLLETLCGRRAVDESLPEDEHILIYWARESINKGNVYEIVAANLRNEISERSLKAFVGVAERCLDSVPKKRPTMGQVVVELESALELQDECDLMSNKVASGSDVEIGMPAVSSSEVEHVIPSPKVDDKQNSSPHLSEQRDVEMVTDDMHKRKKPWARRFWPWSLDAVRIGVKPSEKFIPPRSCKKFTLRQIKAATGNFNEHLVVGRGACGIVYRGDMYNGEHWVAVKRFRHFLSEDHNEFYAEIEILSKLKHRHVVSLIGFCSENGEKILVYDYMMRGSLHDHICNSKSPLHWKQRLRICIDFAKGLDYLHTGVEDTIIHRDVKPTHILLDHNWAVKLSDFGCSKTCLTSEPWVTTLVQGTLGYLDPEYFHSSKLTDKSDVYSSGVVLFQVLCSRPAVLANKPGEERNLVTWAITHYKKGTIDDIIDSNLKGQIAPECLKEFVETAIMCVHLNGTDRPTMRDVASSLEYALQLQEAAEGFV